MSWSLPSLRTSCLYRGLVPLIELGNFPVVSAKDPLRENWIDAGNEHSLSFNMPGFLKLPVIVSVSRETSPLDWFAADCFLRQSNPVTFQHLLRKRNQRAV